MADVAVLGAGAFGTALAVILGGSGRRVVLGVRRREQLDELLRVRENAAYLPGIALPETIELSDDWGAAVCTAGIVVMAVPSRFARAAVGPAASAIATDAILISVTKGIEVDRLTTMSQLLAELAPQVTRVAVLSGPGFAAELARGKPAALVAAAHTESVAQAVQELFAGRTLRVYRSLDVIGVELGGAVKNVIAIAAGVSDGLELGSSARAGLITRGMAEMMRLSRAAGGRRETVAGLAGLGDLVLTCTGALSRNRGVGLALARGEKTGVASGGHAVAEGVSNAAAVHKLAQRLGVEMPIVAAVNRLLYEGAPASAMVEELLSRELKAEFGQEKVPTD